MSTITDPRLPLPYWLQALVDSDFSGPPGTAQTFSYAFAAPDAFGQTSAGATFMSAADQARVRQALDLWSASTGLKFVETSNLARARIQFKYGDLSAQDADGETMQIGTTQATVTIDLKAAGGPLVAQSAWMGLLLHEIGHALGLKHPGDYFNGAEPGPFLSPAEDLRNLTQLAYPYDPLTWKPEYDLSLRPFDTAAAQYLFGVDPALNAGDTVWRYSSLKLPGSLIGDGSGYDTLDASDVKPIGAAGGSGYDMTIDLREGGRIHAGAAQALISAAGQVSINYGTVIEKAIGTAGRDLIIGNAADNQLVGGAGNDTLVGGAGNDQLDGGAGLDAAVFGGLRADYQPSPNRDGWRLVSGADGTDQLVGVERLAFADGALALDVDGGAGPAATIARIIGAVFGKAAVANKTYAGIGLYYLDGGMSQAALMQLALDARLGPQAGATAVVDLLYTNVVGSHPGAGELGYFVGLLEQHSHTPASLGLLAAQTDLNATQIGLAGLVQHGLDYLPYQPG